MSDLATVTRAAPRGMITLRGDLSDAKLIAVVKTLTGQGVPKAGRIAGDGQSGVAWMSPDELLIMVPYERVAEAVAQVSEALAGSHHLAVDVSDARAVFTLVGENAHEVLARLSPVDLHVDRFAIGDFRRTRIAQIAAAFWRHESGFDVVCFRSVGDYAEQLMCNAAQGEPTGAIG